MRLSDYIPNVFQTPDVKAHLARLFVPSPVAVNPPETYGELQDADMMYTDWTDMPEDEEPAVEKEQEVPEKIRRQADEITRHRFQYNDLNHPFVHDLFQISSAKKAQQLLKQPESLRPERFFKDDFGMPGAKGLPGGGETEIDIDRLLERALRTETIPDVYYKIVSAVNDPDVSLDEIAGIVDKDITLSAMILQAVNSSFYSLRQKIDTLTWALALIGTDQLMTLVSGITAVSYFKKIPAKILDMASFWQHSIACGVAARLLSCYFSEKMDAERFFVAGLFHDIGRLILVQNMPGRYLDILHKARQEEVFLFTVEENHFGADHAQIGAEFARQWNLPESLAGMIKNHHFPSRGDRFFEKAVINLADIIVNALGIGSSGEIFVPLVETEVCEELQIDRPLLNTMVTEIEKQVMETFHIIYG
ncbi:MAG: HDOD domain-containing protein [Thermodesulfobacteriota bacterium]